MEARKRRKGLAPRAQTGKNRARSSGAFYPRYPRNPYYPRGIQSQRIIRIIRMTRMTRAELRTGSFHLPSVTAVEMETPWAGNRIKANSSRS